MSRLRKHDMNLTVTDVKVQLLFSSLTSRRNMIVLVAGTYMKQRGKCNPCEPEYRQQPHLGTVKWGVKGAAVYSCVVHISVTREEAARADLGPHESQTQL